MSETRIGARHGPAAIRQQSLTLGPHYPPLSTANALHDLGLVDCGDAAVTPGRIEPSFAAIEDALEPILAAGAVPLTFGGDGSVTLPQLRALKAVTGLLLATLLSLACSGGMRAEDGAAAARGAAQVEKTCIGCHPGPKLDAVVRRHVAGKDAGVALDGFLAGHHVPDAALRADVVAQLRARLDAGAGGE